jgi:hypothetical protein
MASVSFDQFKSSALKFPENPKEFYKNLQTFAKSNIDISLLQIGTRIAAGEIVRYCGKPLDQFPLPYKYLKDHSSKLQQGVNSLISVITGAPKANDQVVQSVKEFLSGARRHTESLNFGLAEVPVIHIADEEAQALKGKIDDLTDPSVFVTLPPAITLRLLMREDPFTDMNCPVVFSETEAVREMALKKSPDKDSPTFLTDYLNQLRDQLIDLKQEKPQVFKDLEDRIYASLSSQDVQKNGETDELYRIVGALSGAISRGQSAPAMNFCMELAVCNNE